MLTIRRKPNRSHLETPGFSYCLSRGVKVFRRCQERTANQESLPPNICYTRRHLHPRLLMESRGNKFGTVQFFGKFGKYTKKLFLRVYCIRQPSSIHIPLCATICRVIWACHVAIHHIEQRVGTNASRPT